MKSKEKVASLFVVLMSISCATQATIAGHDQGGHPSHEDVLLNEATQWSGVQDDAFVGETLTATEAEERAGLVQVVVIAGLKRGFQVAVVTCTSTKACRSKATDMARKAGGIVAETYIGQVAINKFCKHYRSIGAKVGVC